MIKFTRQNLFLQMPGKLLLHLFFYAISPLLWSQTTLFEEDFNTCSLSDQWTYTLEGNQNVRWGVGTPLNPKSDSSTIDGSCLLYIDDDLTGDKTPAFILRFYSSWFNGKGFTDLHLSAQVHFRRDGEEIFRVYADDGSQLHLLREFKGKNYAGTKFSEFVNVTSDLSFVAADSLRLVIEYDDKNNWGWWAGIDNIKVTGSGEGGEIIMGENFNDCNLPQGWSTEILTGEDDWKTGLFTDGKSIDGSCFLYFNDDVLGKEAPLSKHRIYTPFFDADVYERYILTYDFIFRFYEKNEYFQLYVDDGTTWKPVKTYSADFGGPNVDQSLPDTIELSAFKNKRVRLIWEYNDGGWAWWLGMDNIKIVGRGRINDRCNKAIDLSQSINCTEFNNAYALPDDEWQGNTQAVGFVYYTYTPTTSGWYQISTSAEFNDVVQLADGSCETPQILYTHNRDEYGFTGEQLHVQLQADHPYFIRVAGQQAEFGLMSGAGCIAVHKAGPIAEPPLDLCSQAAPVMLNHPCTVAVNHFATTGIVLPTVNQRSRADIWFSFTPDQTGEYTLQSKADFAESIALFQGSCETPVEIASSFAGGSLTHSLTGGNTYYIQITSYFSTLEGKVCLHITLSDSTALPAMPCQQSTPIILNQACTTVSNAGRPFSGKTPACEVYVDSDVWFDFKAGSSGLAYVRIKAGFEYLAALYEGNCNELKSLFCDREIHYCDGYLVFDHLKPGSKYYLQVASKKTQTGFNRGEICIEILDHKPDYQNLSLDYTQECSGHGAVTIRSLATGGRGPYEYYGLGIDSPVKSGESFVIEAVDAEGCVITTTITSQSCDSIACAIVGDITPTHVRCAGDSSGTAIIEGRGGLAPYTYQWSNGVSADQVTQLSAGIYTVTLTDEGGCEWVSMVEITEPDPIASEAAIEDTSCPQGDDGSVLVSVTGGTPPYQYHWSTGISSPDAEGLTAGTYTVTLTDLHGCWVEREVTVSSPDAWVVTIDSLQLTATDDEDAFIGILVSGATPPYQFHWQREGLDIDASGPGLTTRLPGLYTVVIADAKDCVYDTLNWRVERISAVDDPDQTSWGVIYPNPAHHVLWLDWYAPHTLQSLAITSIHGIDMQIRFTALEPHQYAIDVSELEPGWYLLRLISEKGEQSLPWVKIR